MKRQKKPKSTRDTYLKKKFGGLTEAEFNAQLALQNFGCWVCGAQGVTRSLHVDHDHKIESWKIISKKENGAWVSRPLNGKGKLDFEESDRLKQKSRAKVKLRLKRLSCRGILCFTHNVGLRKFLDTHEHLTKAGEYLKIYYEYINSYTGSHFGK